MKKIITAILLLFLGIIKVQAFPLSCQEVEYVAFPYQVGNQTQNFSMFINNETNQIIFSTKPFQKPKWDFNYQNEPEKMQELDENIQNKINFYMRETEKRKDVYTRRYYYIITQVLIWQTFHPEIIVELPEDNEREIFREELEEKFKQLPKWLHDSEIKNSLFLPKEEQYNLSSKDCEIIDLEDKIEIKNCKPNAELIVEENIEDTLKISSNESVELIEGYAKRKWKIKLEKKEEEQLKLKENLSFEIHSEVDLYSLIEEDNHVKIVSENEKISTDTLGAKEIKIKYEKEGSEEEQTVIIQIVDTHSPTIEYKKELTTTVGNKIDLLKDVFVQDNSKEEIKVTVIGEYDWEKEGIYHLKYVAMDSSKNKTEESFLLRVQKNQTPPVIEETEEKPETPPNQSWTLQQVPNTLEHNFPWFGIVFLIGIVFWKKK